MRGIEYSEDSGQNVSSSEDYEDTEEESIDEYEKEIEELNRLINERFDGQKGIDEWKYANDRLASCCERLYIERRNGNKKHSLNDVDVKAVNTCFDYMRMWTKQEFKEYSVYGLRMLNSLFRVIPTQQLTYRHDLLEWLMTKSEEMTDESFTFAMGICHSLIGRDETLGDSEIFKRRVIDTFLKIDINSIIKNEVSDERFGDDVITSIGVFSFKSIFDYSTDVGTDRIDEKVLNFIQLNNCLLILRKICRNIADYLSDIKITINDKVLEIINMDRNGGTSV